MHARRGETALLGGLPGGVLKKIYLCNNEEFIYLTPTPRFPAPQPVIPLPPLECLRVLEAAARHQRFALAGKKFGVTAAAGHRIRMLESHRGAELFARRPRLPELPLTRRRARAAHPPRSRESGRTNLSFVHNQDSRRDLPGRPSGLLGGGLKEERR